MLWKSKEHRILPYTGSDQQFIQVSSISSDWQRFSRLPQAYYLLHCLPLENLKLQLLRIEPRAFCILNMQFTTELPVEHSKVPSTDTDWQWLSRVSSCYSHSCHQPPENLHPVNLKVFSFISGTFISPTGSFGFWLSGGHSEVGKLPFLNKTTNGTWQWMWIANGNKCKREEEQIQGRWKMPKWEMETKVISNKQISGYLPA